MRTAVVSMLRWGALCALCTTVLWGLWSIWAPVPEVSRLLLWQSEQGPRYLELGFGVSRWWDIIGSFLGAAIMRGLTLLYDWQDDDWWKTLLVSVFIGLGVGLVVGLSCRLGFGLSCGLGFGLVVAIQKIYHLIIRISVRDLLGKLLRWLNAG